MKLRQSTKVIYAILVATSFLLALGPAAITANASTGPSYTIKVTGIWQLTYLNSTVLYTKGHIQYGAGYGTGNFTGGIHGNNSAGEFLTAYNLKTQVIHFTGQIQCICTIDGKTGSLWISMIHGIDHNASNPNGKTTALFVITYASGKLKGTTGYGPMVTTTSSNDMNYTMWIKLG